MYLYKLSKTHHFNDFYCLAFEDFVANPSFCLKWFKMKQFLYGVIITYILKQFCEIIFKESNKFIDFSKRLNPTVFYDMPTNNSLLSIELYHLCFLILSLRIPREKCFHLSEYYEIISKKI